MNEEALSHAFDLFVKDGYSGNINDFKSLISSNEEAISYVFDLFSKDGYEGSQNDFRGLIGLKKKEEGLAGQVQPQAQSQPTQGQPQAQGRQQDVTESNLDVTSSVSKDTDGGYSITTTTPAGKATKEFPSWAKAPEGIGAPMVEQKIASSDRASELAKIRKEERFAYMGKTPESIAKESEEFAKKEKKQNEFNERSKSVADWESSIGQLSPELIDYDEEYVVPNLRYLFGKYGFRFNETGARDNVEIVSPDGKRKIFQIDTFTESGDKESLKDITEFIKSNKPEIANAVSQLSKYEANIKTDEEKDRLISDLNSEADALRSEIDGYTKEVNQLNIDKAKFGNTEDVISRAEALSKKAADLQERQSNIKPMEDALSFSIGRYMQMKSEQGDYIGALAKNAMGSISGPVSGFVRTIGDLATSFIPLSALMGEQNYKDSFVKYAKDKFNKEYNPSDDFEKWKSSLGEDKIDEINDLIRSRDISQGAVKEISDLTREGLPKLMVPSVTTEAAERMTSENIITGAPLMLASAAAPMAAGIVSAPASIALFSFHALDNVNKEMDSNPEFSDIPVGERYLASVPISLATGVLMGMNLGHVVGNKVLFDDIVMSAIKKSGRKTTAEGFRQFVENEVSDRVARGVLTLAPKAAAGATFGAGITISETGIKEAYNLAKEKKMFQTPETLGEFGSEVANSMAALAIGDMLMGSINALKTGYRSNNYNGVSDANIKFLDYASSSPESERYSRESYIVKLKSSQNQGKISPSQVLESIKEYDRAMASYKSMPSDLSPAKKRQALSLLTERSRLEDSIQGKDDAMVVRQKNRIKEINKSLEEVSKPEEDAIQKPTTEEGVLRPEGPTVELPKVGEGDQGKVAAEAGVPSAEAVRQVTDAELSGLMAYGGTMDMVNKIISQGISGKRSPQQVSEDVSNYLKGTNTYKTAPTDLMRESLLAKANELVLDQVKEQPKLTREEMMAESMGSPEIRAQVDESFKKTEGSKVTLENGEEATIKVEPLENNDIALVPEYTVSLIGKNGETVSSTVYNLDPKTGKIQRGAVSGAENFKFIEQTLSEGGMKKEGGAFVFEAKPAPEVAVEAEVELTPAKTEGEFEIVSGGKKLGQIKTEAVNDTDVKVSMVEVYEQKKGTATKAYAKLADMLAAQGKKLVSDEARSDESEALWSSLEKKGLAKKVGDVTGERFDYTYEYVIPAKEKAVEVPKEEQLPLSESTLPGYDTMMATVERVISDSKSRGRTKEEIADNVIKHLQSKSPEYAKATDVQREQIVGDVNERFGIKMKRTPSAKRVLGETAKESKITATEKSLLKDKIRNLARGAREAKQAISVATKAIGEEISKLVKSGKVTANQAATLSKRLSSLNPLNPKSVIRFLDYAEKVFNDADYQNKLRKAQDVRGRLSKLSNNKDKNTNLREAAKAFLKIDPSMVDNIDAYNEMASKIQESLKGSTIKKGEPIFAEIVKISDVADYVKSTLEAQAKKMYDERAEEIQELMGIEKGELTYDEMQMLLEGTKEMTKSNEGVIRATIKRMFDLNAAIIKSIMSEGKDPFTGEKVSIPKEKAEDVKDFMSMDLSFLTPKEAIQAVDALHNFIQNKSTAKMKAVYSDYLGRVNSKTLENNKFESSPIRMYWSKVVGRTFLEQFTTLPLVAERMFKGFNKAMLFDRMSGLSDLYVAKSTAEKISNNTVDEYVSKFYDKQANKTDFNSSINNVERGMLAFMSRTLMAGKAEIGAEFKRRKGLIEQSIKRLESGNDKEQDMAVLYKTMYDKILKDAENVDQVRAKADKTNLDAVDWWVNKWSEVYPELSDISEGVYNRELGKDHYYTPDQFFKLKESETPLELSNDESAFLKNDEFFYKKETGVLKKAVRPEELPADRYIDLSFDKNNANSFYDAMVDIKTATHIRQVESFLNSESLNKVIKNSSDRSLLKRRVSAYIKNFRGKNLYERSDVQKFIGKLNRLSSIAASQALAGPTQPIKQVIPVAVNTLMNAKGLDLSSISDKSKNDFINRSGYGIANRGIESLAQIESISKLVDLAAKSKGAKALEYIEKANERYLNWFLKNPDVAIARASWMTYYEKALRNQGMSKAKIKGIDWNTHEVNRNAADYAQRMVDRQQNISDKDMQGAMFASKNPVTQLAVKISMPFASFRMNQTSRMMNDIAVLSSKTSTKEDKLIAARSLAGFSAEMGMFKLISGGLQYMIGGLTKSIMGMSEDDKEAEKRLNSVLKGQVTSAVTDVFSPIPVLDKPVAALGNETIEMIQSSMGISEEDMVNIYGNSKSDFIHSLGTFGVTTERANQLYDLGKLAMSREFTDDYGNKKVISQKQAEGLRKVFGMSLLANIGIIPAGPEIGSIARNAIKYAEKSGKSKAEYEKQKMLESLGYETTGELKENDPELYEWTFGKYSPEYEMKKEEKEMKKAEEE